MVWRVDHSTISEGHTRHLYDYCVQLEVDQSTRKMKLPLDKYTGDSDAAVGSWVLLESISRSGRVRRTNITLVDSRRLTVASPRLGVPLVFLQQQQYVVLLTVDSRRWSNRC